ncbi:hypothetical protein KXJ72_14670 [Comamonas aquatica]|nr:hypothetical protein KXJ72_14670 [Comamonas aquatica]
MCAIASEVDGCNKKTGSNAGFFMSADAVEMQRCSEGVGVLSIFLLLKIKLKALDKAGFQCVLCLKALKYQRCKLLFISGQPASALDAIAFLL